MSDFPADFIWGSGTAAQQVEDGNDLNDCWDWGARPQLPYGRALW
ncbi:MAG TPA: hypothetical protein VHW74_14020 [Mycobacteriales bacterium]|nr:hypothetical protein [Mycobacteriales bacterium]